MRKHFLGIAALILICSTAGCDLFGSLEVENRNSPDMEAVFADPLEYPSLLSGAYRTWWNQNIGTNPNLALGVAAEIFTSGFGSWGMDQYYQVPRQPIANVDADDVVLNPLYGAWYSYYSGLPTANNIIRQIEQNGRQVMVGNTNYTQGALAHAYFLQGLFIGHLALIYDQAFLITEDTDIVTFEYQFTPARELVEFALERMDRAIAICSNESFTDPIRMLPDVEFNNQSLCRFINSNAARILVGSARTAAEANELDWNRVLGYARNGIVTDFRIMSAVGWNGLAITRDTFSAVQIAGWDWIRPHQRIVNMLAPNDPGAVYPWPTGTTELPRVTDILDHRLETDFLYVGRHPSWNVATRGYHILSNYKYNRYQPYMDTGSGPIYFFLAAENDLLLAEALIRSGGSTSEAADLINNTRVGRGQMAPVAGTDSREVLLAALFHERYIELMFTFPPLGYFDRRRSDSLMPGTANQFPVPAKELLLHGHPVYTFGG